jgi:hypothetical protein
MCVRICLSAEYWLGNSAGRKPLLDTKQQKFLIEMIVRHYRANNGKKSPAEAIDLIQEIGVNLDRKQLSQQTFQHCTIRHQFKGVISQTAKARESTGHHNNAVFYQRPAAVSLAPYV